ncbi:MAG: class I SAM-dependent methyltransferase [Cyanomargarita calcarea GSE-NOS-MK-12-04C]|uniref:Class I SAM-dependent methyltransferase n=1 Tax=Cyanomargarita calcarea GSE-NOS-MK-12-04C TaxID=2839659 RepID=A0A951QPU2_9CYAN|nr:class I SAM-dependent methyltransferase [Cyanomargarita calcarea GSE-NOS-MK-12-04C]
MNSTRALCEALVHSISTSPLHRITFAQYMSIVLYHTKYGYYSTAAVNLGKKGDFFTSVHLGADFGELLTEQFVQMWEILGRPKPFTLVEMGAGQGLLALDTLKYMKQEYPDFFDCLDCIIVEKSPGLREVQQQYLQEFPVRWCNLEDIQTNSITGCFFSNELVDAFPVHQCIIENGQLQEIYVTTEKNPTQRPHTGSGESLHQTVLEKVNYEFTEVTGEPSTFELAKYFDLVGIKITESVYPEGYRSEVNLAALQWLSILSDKLQRGYVLTIDYGYPASRYYNPRRSQGTLQCYYQHHRHSNPYINIGQQDITTHVDFTALEKWGKQCGLDKVGFTQQALFLMSLGLGARIASLSHQQQPISQLLQRRDALHQLHDPMGLGSFGVLAQTKGLTEAENLNQLKGFAVPE